MSLRRLLVLVLLVAAGAAAFARLRSRNAGDPVGPPEWPPFEPRIVAPPTEPATPDRPAQAWVVPAPDGTIPEDHPVKVKVSSGIYHVPGGRFYERTTADRCYPDTAAAEADGYRPAKS